ncbi:MAG: right-handed parallel beta-helix repeat-containing protein [Sedimentisphaerales bacterium]|nr:right-handed parallel beta-helix repeat-containing protein [Sedimentisphaerales bacterium]
MGARIRKALYGMVLVQFLCLGISTAGIIYVDDTAPGPHDGTSWATAYRYLQDALLVAVPGDTIRVGQGIYRPNQATIPGVTDRKATFQLKNGVALYGGYAGYGAPNPNARNVTQYKTILSGDLNGDDVLLQITDRNLVHQLLTAPTRQDNAYTVVTASNTDASAVLDGFVITCGNANGPSDFPYMYERGGGLFAYKGSPTIRNCTFQVNASLSYGGAVAIYQGAALMEKCTFKANFSKGGGGAINNWVADTTTRSCTFVWNEVLYDKWGGAIYSRDCKPIIEKCTFTQNYGGMEGGAISNDNCDAQVVDCLFVENEADYGGAIENTTGSYPSITRCSFVRNTSTDWGGAAFNYYCSPTYIHCKFIANRSSNGVGGAMYNRYSETMVFGCLFNGNQASTLGGGVANYDTDLRITNCTFSANYAPQAKAIVCEPGGTSGASHVTVTSCILWDGGLELQVDPDSQMDVEYSDVQGGAPGAGNINANPLFESPTGGDGIPGTEDDDLRLRAGSPCIDAGANYGIPVGITTDLDGSPRRVDDPTKPDTGAGTPPIVDMGAYEYQAGGPGPGNNPPVADAGPDQTVPADPSGYAFVTLDGSGSYDPDGDSLVYIWSWTIGGTPYQAYGVSPTIQLPLGQHIITLVVFDGSDYSAPDQVQIDVVTGTIPANVTIYPYQISRTSGGAYVYALVRLFDVHKNEVNMGIPLTIIPGNVQAFTQYASEQSDGTVVTTIIGLFFKNQLTAAIPGNGPVTLTVTGRLNSGVEFSGSNTVTIVP